MLLSLKGARIYLIRLMHLQFALLQELPFPPVGTFSNANSTLGINITVGEEGLCQGWGKCSPPGVRAQLPPSIQTTGDAGCG